MTAEGQRRVDDGASRAKTRVAILARELPASGRQADGKTGISPKRSTLRACQASYDAVFSLGVELHYLSCTGGVGKTRKAEWLGNAFGVRGPESVARRRESGQRGRCCMRDE